MRFMQNANGRWPALPSREWLRRGGEFLALRRNTSLLLCALVLVGTGEKLWVAPRLGRRAVDLSRIPSRRDGGMDGSAFAREHALNSIMKNLALLLPAMALLLAGCISARHLTSSAEAPVITVKNPIILKAFFAHETRLPAGDYRATMEDDRGVYYEPRQKLLAAARPYGCSTVGCTCRKERGFPHTIMSSRGTARARNESSKALVQKAL